MSSFQPSINYSVQIKGDDGYFERAFVQEEECIEFHVSQMLKQRGIKWTFSTEEESPNHKCKFRTWFNGKYGQPDCQEPQHIVAMAHEIYP